MQWSMVKTASGELIKRAVPPLTLWAIARVLDVPRVKRTLRKVDRKVLKVAVKRHFVPRGLLRFLTGMAFLFVGGVMIARSRRPVEA